jgi:hypothetical protein
LGEDAVGGRRDGGREGTAKLEKDVVSLRDAII